MRTLIAVLAAVLVSGAARAQELTKDMCDQIEQRTGHRPPDCEKLVDGATTDDNNNAPATITSNAPASVTPTPPPPTYPGPANPVPGGTTPGGTTPGGTAPAGGSMTIPNYTAPAMTGGTPSSSDCDHWGTALDVAGSFTNYAFWMTDSKGVMAERKTLHGIYLEDASQNAGDARDRAAASVGAAQGCDALSG